MPPTSESTLETPSRPRLRLQNVRFPELLGLFCILLLAAGLRFANLKALGYVNHYYTAADISMLKSWHNFFFAVGEPGGAVSVDKPPVGLWIQALSVAVFGVNSLGVLLPEILAGLASVVVVYHLARRSFGVPAGMFAALALAVTPVVLATDRNNTIDSLLILVLLLASWAFIKATETARLRFLLLGAVLVGVGFNIKMLEAFLPVPAFFVLYLLGASEGIGRKLGKLVLASVLLVAISLSWVTIVDLTPASQRPYVGSSGDNSEMSLILGYNGLDRLNGMMGGAGQARPGGQSFNSSGQSRPGGMPAGPGGAFTPPFQGGPIGNNARLGQGGPGNADGRPQPGGMAGGPAGGSNGMFDTGQPGVLRMFIPPLSKNASWLLPFGLAGLALLLFSGRIHFPFGTGLQAAILWGGWLVTAGVFFSIAGFFHEYYLAVLAPPMALLVGSGAGLLWKRYDGHPVIVSALLVGLAGITLFFQSFTARSYVPLVDWLACAIALLVVAGGLLIVAILRRSPRLAGVGLSLGMIAMLVAPAFWSGLTALYPNQNQSLPGAYGGSATGPVDNGGVQVNQALINYLEVRTGENTYLMAVPSSMQGSDYVIATGRPVLYLGGYMGRDNVLTTDQLSEMVQQGQLRYLYINSGRNGIGNLSVWVGSHCTVVPGFETQTGNTGAPDGTGTSAGQGNQPGGGMQLALYDCGK